MSADAVIEIGVRLLREDFRRMRSPDDQRTMFEGTESEDQYNGAFLVE